MDSHVKPFSTPLFILGASVQALALFGLLFLLSKYAGLSLNLNLAKVTIVFFAMQVVTCFFEFFLHRYILHAVLFPFLKGFASAHRKHHSLTPKHRFVIKEVCQYESQAFPWWALSAFYLVFAPFIIMMQVFLPDWPVLIGGFAAVTWSLLFYEIVHNFQHKPLDFWQPLFSIPVFGRAIRSYYLDHLNHHANVKVNEAITGYFCGIKLFDYIFRTSHQAASLQVDGTCSDPRDLRPKHQPLGIIVWLDKIASQQEARLRRSS